MSHVNYVRLYTGQDGKSCLQSGLTIGLSSADFVPPAPPIEVSALSPCSKHGFLLVPQGYDGDWHPSPKRQWIFFLAGEMVFETGDGQSYHARPGDAMLLEDTIGQGHRSRVVSDTATLLAAVQL